MRAKARRDRWREEVIKTSSEMSWVKAYYSKQAETWASFLTNAAGPGAAHERPGYNEVAWEWREQWNALHKSSEEIFSKALKAGADRQIEKTFSDEEIDNTDDSDAESEWQGLGELEYQDNL